MGRGTVCGGGGDFVWPGAHVWAGGSQAHLPARGHHRALDAVVHHGRTCDRADVDVAAAEADHVEGGDDVAEGDHAVLQVAQPHIPALTRPCKLAGADDQLLPRLVREYRLVRAAGACPRLGPRRPRLRARRLGIRSFCPALL